jgi:uridine phosphorylase
VTNSIHLQPTAELADRVLLPGDPGRALMLAQLLLAEPRMFNHHRGLWGYSGTAADGAPLSIQSTGMGGPSAAIVTTELIDLGARRLLRVGTCAAFGNGLALGDLVIATDCIPADGASRALGAGERPTASRRRPGPSPPISSTTRPTTRRRGSQPARRSSRWRRRRSWRWRVGVTSRPGCC